MEDVLWANLPHTTVSAINRCRIAHQAIYWSDVANGWGDSISPRMLRPSTPGTNSTWSWPPEFPSRSDWAHWSAFLKDSPRTSSGYFILPLGPWIHRSHRLDFAPFCTVSQTAVIQGHGQLLRLFSSNSSHAYRVTKSFPFQQVSVTPPSTDHLARIEHSTSHSLVLSGSTLLALTPTTPPLAWPLHSAHFPDHGQSVAASLANGTALAICDGSYMPKRFPGLAAAAWVIQPGSFRDNAHIPCHSVTQVQGPTKSINSYRAELQGLYTLLLAINHICSLHHLTSGRATIGCDNKGVLHHVHFPPRYVPCAVKHADLVRAIHSALRHCPLQLSFQYVAGHQDDLTRFEDLPPLAQLNVQADLMAKQALYVLGSNNNPACLAPLPGVQWALSIGDNPITTEPRAAILNHLSALTAIPYWISKGHLTTVSAQLVDWSLLERALSDRPPTYRMWLSKFASGHSAVARTMHRWQRWDSAICPICQTVEEDMHHIFLCPDAECTAHWHTSIDSL